jgi:peptidoglycan hydrolase-like protein with peptidoglycan-binding domain
MERQDEEMPTGGRAAAGSGRAQPQGVSLSAEQQTRIRETVLSRRDAPRHDRVEFSISVGTNVPTHVELVEVPPALVEIHPEWRGDSYFLVQDEIVIVDRDHRITAVIPTGGSRADAGRNSSGGGGSDTGRGSSRDEAGDAVALNLSSDEIREVQLVLIRRGFLDGEADGVIGPRTREALIKFQRERGLSGSGNIDTRTIDTLDLSSKVNVQQNAGQREGSEPSRAGAEGGRQPGQRAQPSGQASDQSGTGARNGQSTTGQSSPSANKDNGSPSSTTGRGGDQLPSRSSSPGSPDQSSAPNRSVPDQGGGSDRPSGQSPGR